MRPPPERAAKIVGMDLNPGSASRGNNPDRLMGVMAKIERARQHIRDFEARRELFIQSRPYDVVRDDPQAGVYGFVLRFRCKPPRDMPLTIGDAVHNLRSALDHLAWQLVEANGQTPSKDTAFPIFETADKYKKHSASRVEGMSTGAISLINAIQPYQGGNDDLWELHRLDILDKHRLQYVVEYSDVPTRLKVVSHVGTSIVHQFVDPNDIGMLHDGAKLALEGSHVGDVQTSLDLTIDIAFRDSQTAYGKPVLPFLYKVANLVDSIANQFAPFV